MKNLSGGRAIGAGLLAGAFAGLVMTVVMLLLAWLGRVATPLAILGDRLSVFIPPGPFLSIMGRVGGYGAPNDLEYSPSLGRRGFVLGGLGLLVAGGGAAVVRRLYQLASFSYDGTQYKGAEVEGITPNDKFYCVTKNVIDPKVDEGIWRLEVTGLVRQRQTYKIDRLKALPAVSQETTLMCISNGLGRRFDEQRGLARRPLKRAAARGWSAPGRGQSTAPRCR